MEWEGCECECECEVSVWKGRCEVSVLNVRGVSVEGRSVSSVSGPGCQVPRGAGRVRMAAG